MKKILLAAGALLLALAGCATVALSPAPNALLVPGQKNAAYAVASNVRVTVRTRSWRGYPGDLEQTLTPVEVAIENNSGHPLALRYENFALVGAAGFHYEAIPPFVTQGEKRSERPAAAHEGEGALRLVAGAPPPPPAVGTPAPGGGGFGGVHGGAPPGGGFGAPLGAPPGGVGAPHLAPLGPPPPAGMVRPVPPPAVGSPPGVFAPPHPVGPIHPHFNYYGFYVAPWYSPFYPGIGVWSGPFYWDSYYYGRYYGYWPEPLPTRDMLEVALPEGVLENGGRITGFLYFPSIQRETGVTFQAQLKDAKTGELLGTASIPMVVSH